MPVPITGFRVFLASPGGLQDERKRFRKILENFNEYSALPRSVYFQAVGWEDTLGGVGRPQEIINEDLRTCDFFLMMLWDRWGTPPNVLGATPYTSGTEEEFHVAKECLLDESCAMRQLVVMFKAIDARRLSDPGGELKKVLVFKKELEEKREHLYHTFDDLQNFEEILHRFLNRWLMDHERKVTKKFKQSLKITPLSEPVITETLLKGSHEKIPEAVAHAEQLVKQGKLLDAESAFAIAVANGTNPAALEAYGNFLIQLGRFSQAQSVFEELERLSSKAGEKWRVIALSGLGRVLIHRRQFLEAEEVFRRALDLTRTLDIPGLRGDILSNLVRAMVSRNELNGAEIFALDAISIFEKMNNLSGIAQAKTRLGDVYRSKKEMGKAEASYKEALEIFRKLGDEGGTVVVLNNFGVMRLRTGILDEAEKLFAEALVINEKLQRVAGVAHNRANLGNVQFKRKNFAAAKKQFQAAFDIFTSLGLADSANNMAAQIEKITNLANPEK